MCVYVYLCVSMSTFVHEIRLLTLPPLPSLPSMPAPRSLPCSSLPSPLLLPPFSLRPPSLPPSPSLAPPLPPPPALPPAGVASRTGSSVQEVPVFRTRQDSSYSPARALSPTSNRSTTNRPTANGAAGGGHTPAAVALLSLYGSSRSRPASVKASILKSPLYSECPL